MTVARRGGRWLGEHLVLIYALLALAYLFVPIGYTIAFSFNNAGKSNLVWRGFTLNNWENPCGAPQVCGALSNSLKIGFLATVISTVLGTMMAFALARHRFRGRTGMNLLIFLPMATPEVVLGASLLTMFLNLRIDPGFATIVIAHVMFCISYVALTVKARIRGFDWTLEDAAMDLGAGPTRTFLKVTLPLITPGILAAFLLSFALSIDDFIITYFVSGPSEQTFPIRIFGQSRTATPPQINVLATMILVVSIAVLAIGTFAGQRRQRRMGAAA